MTKLPLGGVYSSLRWSPDDRQLVYIQEWGTGTWDMLLMVVAAAGGNPQHAAGGFPNFGGATWLSDGSGLIVSFSQGSQMPYPPTNNLWEVPLDGGAPAPLTFGESSYEFPDVGAQGNLVVSRVRMQSDVWKFPITGSPEENAQQGTRLTRQTGLLQTASASPDESEIVLLRWRD